MIISMESHDPIDRRFLLGGLAGAAGITALSAMSRTASAGPLSPPAGAVASTGKPIGEVEPRIAVNATNTPGNATYLHNLPGPGSYYLTGNLSVPFTGRGILLGARATLDLNGYSINGSGVGSVGVVAGDGSTVRNGTITNVGSGVSVSAGPSTAVLVEDVTIAGFGNRAIDVGGRSVVRRCNVIGGGVVGIELQGDYGVVEDCTVTNPLGTGVYINSYSALRRSSVNQCQIGAYIGFGSFAQACAFSACNNIGLQASQRSSVHGCTVVSVTVGFGGALGAGIDLGDGAEAVGCSDAQCFYGIRASTGTRIVECAADGCSSSAIRLTSGANTVEACRLNRSGTGVDMTGTGGNYIHKCVLLGNSTAVAVNVAGNWYPTVALANVNSATNPLASVVG